MCGSHDDPELLILETYTTASQRRRLGHRDDLGYMLEVLRNTVLNADRHRRLHAPQSPRWEESVTFVLDADADRGISLAETRAAYRALHQLEPAQRDTLVAVDIVGLSYRQAARALGTREQTIVERLLQGREQLANRLPLLSAA
jgi:RNA polymerase sigma-70 factor (ECF subfamily)